MHTALIPEHCSWKTKESNKGKLVFNPAVWAKSTEGSTEPEATMLLVTMKLEEKCPELICLSPIFPDCI